LACKESEDSLPFSGDSSIPLCCITFPATLLHQLFFPTPLLHLAIYFLVYLLVLLIPNSYTILVWEFYFLPFSVHVQTNVIYVALLFLLWQVFKNCINLYIYIFIYYCSLILLHIRTFLSTVTQCDIFFSFCTQWFQLTISSPTFQNFRNICDVLSEVSNFQHHKAKLKM
jgi:hypothetical protein